MGKFKQSLPEDFSVLQGDELDGEPRVFRVGFWYTVYGTATHIEAPNAEEAEKWLQAELEQNGLDDIEYKTNDRDYGAQDARLQEDE